MAYRIPEVSILNLNVISTMVVNLHHNLTISQKEKITRFYKSD